MAKHTISKAQFSRKRKDPATGDSSKPKFSGFSGRPTTMRIDTPRGLLKPPAIHPHRTRAVKRAKRIH
jgi:hypothetical protein